MNTLGISPSFAIYMDIEVWCDWLLYGQGEVTFAEWCGVEPYRDDPYLVWC